MSRGGDGSDVGIVVSPAAAAVLVSSWLVRDESSSELTTMAAPFSVQERGIPHSSTTTTRFVAGVCFTTTCASNVDGGGGGGGGGGDCSSCGAPPNVTRVGESKTVTCGAAAAAAR